MTARGKPGSVRILSESPEETRRFAARLARQAEVGDVICLIGPLGSGKTTFAQGFARGVGFRGNVTSPSFGIAREYRTRRKLLYHLDLFRVEKRELPNLDLEEYLHNPEAICLVEWPEIIRPMLPADRLEIQFKSRGLQMKRSLLLRSSGSRSQKLLRCAA